MMPMKMPSRENVFTKLNHRRALVANLCAALEAFLAVDIEDQLQMLQEYGGPSLEDLDAAQRHVDMTSQQLEALNGHIDNMPEDTRNLMRAQITPLEMLLKLAEDRRDAIHKEMENFQPKGDS